MSDELYRILGIDFGTVRIGIALSDPTRVIAKGVVTIQNDGHVFDKLQSIIAEQDVRTIVVGYPLDLKGQPGAKTVEVDNFIQQLRSRCSLPVIRYDERFTSVIAEKAMLTMGTTKKQRRNKGKIDQIASAVMLQGYLDSVQKAR